MKKLIRKIVLTAGVACLPTAVSHGAWQCLHCKEAHAKNKTSPLFSCHKLKTMAQHLLREHRICLCCECKKSFTTFNAYRTHMSAVHKKTACSYCIWRTFKTREDCELHEDGQHITYAYKCAICLERFPTTERWIIHTNTRHKRYPCWYCLKKGFKDDGKKCKKVSGFKDKDQYRTHVLREHGKIICPECNIRAFKTENDYNEHCKDGHKKGKFKAECARCGHPNTFRYKAERRLHELQHAFLLFFLEETICGYECCIPFQKAVFDSDRVKGKSLKERKNSRTEDVRAFATHVTKAHNRCLFCENSLTDESRKRLGKNLASVQFSQITEDARMFIRLKEDTFSKGEIPVIPCDMCESALQPNRKSRLFFASIKEFPFGKGLDIRDYPFYHLEYDERKAEKNTMMSVIKEAPENMEESYFAPKKDEKDNVISGEEDEAEDEECCGDKEEDEKEEDKKEDEKEPDPEH